MTDTAGNRPSKFEEASRLYVLATSTFLFALACMFAVFEIEAEGKHGWAEKFPTWYRVETRGAKAWQALFGKKPLTGYHLALFPVPAMFFAWPMVKNSNVTLSGLLLVVASYLAWAPVWDFAWFVLNPHFGIQRFRRGQVWWFDRDPWILGRIPLGYVIAWCLSLVVTCIASIIDHGNWQYLRNHAASMGYFLCFLGVLTWLGTPVFHAYYKKMRQSDERPLAGRPSQPRMES